MSKDKNKLMPVLRFPEFLENGEWEEKSLKNYIGLFSGIALKSEELSDDKSGIPILRGINITEGYIRHLKDIDKYFLGELENLNKYLVKENDIVIGMDGSKVGKNIALIKKKDENSILIQRVARIRTNNKSDINFVYQHFISYKFREYVDRVNTSSGIPHISAQQIKEFKTGFPPELKEQQKIASCLSSLDEVIAAHSQKLATLKDHKKGLMQNLFPQMSELGLDRLKDDKIKGKEILKSQNPKNHNSDNVPNYRFPEFLEDGEWEGKSIGEFAPLQRGFDLPVDNIILGKYPVVFSNGISKYHAEYKVKAPGIVTGRSGTIGKVTYVKENFWPHNTSLWVTDFCGNIPMFVFYYFILIRLEQFGTGSGVPTLNRNDVHRQIILIPKPKEQQKIASCLSSLDDLITAQAEKIAQLKLHKKGLMQGLFPKSITN